MKAVIRISLLILISLFVVYFISLFISEKILVTNKFNGCIDCHGEMDGFESAHSPEKIGCEACHLGNLFTSNKDFAHEGMITIPGNLSDAEKTCGAVGCHPGIPQRRNSSLMNTLSGLISVDRFAFDELGKPEGLFRVKDLTQSDADNHLRNLCASCHLGNEKIDLGTITELSRGGGCNACHLNYNNEAIQQLNAYRNSDNKEKDLPTVHPQLNLNISNDHCFGCHARSGRISTNFEGWFETLFSEEEVRGEGRVKDNFKVLMDGRVFQKVKEDVHHLAGMECIDCHLSIEVMGNGNIYDHMEEQVRIQCVDCHSTETRSVSYDQLDFESKKIVNLRNLKYNDDKFLVTRRNQIPLVNAFVNSSSQKYLITKNKKVKLQLKPPAAICVEKKSHKRLSCSSCHTEWVSHCVGCHTEFDPKLEGYDLLDNKDIVGSWKETPSDFYVDYPVLGVRREKSGKEIIGTFIPGMVVIIEKMRNNPDKKIFKRLFAPSFSHTINKEGRSCKSCHDNPLALGYGKGELIFDKSKKWKFIPQFSNHNEDNLPKDAWIGFLKMRDETSTTRTNTRPFSIEEQKRILLVGVCLTCHDEQSEVMKKSLADFDIVRKNISSKCILPVWN
jgi:hypothetical protein